MPLCLTHLLPSSLVPPPGFPGILFVHEDYDPAIIADKINSASEKNTYMAFCRRMVAKKMERAHPELVAVSQAELFMKLSDQCIACWVMCSF